MNSKKTVKIKNFIFLHSILLLYSLCGIFSKLASKEEFLSVKFIFYYGMVIFILFIYAVLWQQVLKKMTLTIAFLNKAIVVVWGILWGALIFGEEITWKMILGAIIIIIGISVVVFENEN